MSKCAVCHGSGSAACEACDGMGYVLDLDDKDEMIRRLCEACHGKPLHTCRACAGSGVVGKASPIVGVPAAAAADGKAAATLPGHAMPDRLAGKWKADEGTWYEFIPDGHGNHYRVTAGGLAGVSGNGTATLTGHSIKVEATDRLVGPYELELTMRGSHLDGIDRKLGFPIPIVLMKS
jgi:DnaJ-class molecular chaperone